MPLHDQIQIAGILDEVRTHGRETGVFEAKVSLADPHEIGEYISALSNTAALNGEAFGFLVWGLEDETLAVIGTKFSHLRKAKGNEDFVPWLTRLLNPQLHFEFCEVIYEGERIVLLTVEAAKHQPVRFDGQAYIRVESYKKPLKSLQDYERRLWQAFSSNSYEQGIARDRLQPSDVTNLLDYDAYFRLIGNTPPESIERIVEVLKSDGLVARSLSGDHQITNLGAILLARDLNEFPSVKRKAPRVTRYDGADKSAAARGVEGSYGYAVGFQGLLTYIRDQIPAVEEFPDGVRTEVAVIPEKAVRELVANALIHQDLSITGTGPIVDIFNDRIEVTNPGQPLVDRNRLIDAPPRSRNEALASLMRRFGFCEERGSGWDQIAALVEVSELPPPLVEVGEEFMRVTLFSHCTFSEFTREERVRAVYFHACLQQVRKLRTTNASLRGRFRVSEKNKAAISRLIADAVAEGIIVVHDESVGPKARSYVPFWAK